MQRGLPVMGYTPLGGTSVLRDPTLERIGATRGCSTAAVALAWAIRSGNVIAIPESGLAAHAKENAVALFYALRPGCMIGTNGHDAMSGLRWLYRAFSMT